MRVKRYKTKRKNGNLFDTILLLIYIFFGGKNILKIYFVFIFFFVTSFSIPSHQMGLVRSESFFFFIIILCAVAEIKFTIINNNKMGPGFYPQRDI